MLPTVVGVLVVPLLGLVLLVTACGEEGGDTTINQLAGR